MKDPKTIPEMLDAAQNGQEFQQVLTDLFTALNRVMAGDDTDV